MSTKVEFVLTDAQEAAMILLGIGEPVTFVNAALQTKLTNQLVYLRSKAEDDALENYNRIKGYLAAQKMEMPETFGAFKIRTMAEFQNALDELGYKPNKKKASDSESDAQ